MKKYIIPLLLSVVLISCGNEEAATDSAIAEDTVEHVEDADNNIGGFYKRYTGTIANIPVTVNLVQYGDSIIRGAYYYDKIGNVITLFGSGKIDEVGRITFNEAVDTEKNKADKTGASWHVSIHDGTMKGEWVSKENADKVYEIVLTEDYTNAQQLGVIYKNEKRHYKGDTSMPYATYEQQALFPQKGDENGKYYYTVISKKSGCKIEDRQMLIKCMDNSRSSYFDTYNLDLKDMEEQGGIEKSYSFNYALNTNQFIYYNAHGWLSLCESDWTYTGGAHGNYGSGFTCIDLQDKKVWKLEDIVGDKNALLAVAEKDIRKQFDIPKGHSLDSRLLVDELEITDNFFLTHKGITLSYTPYEIASYADGEVLVFIPFNKIMDLLTPAFKERMQMNPPNS